MGGSVKYFSVHWQQCGMMMMMHWSYWSGESDWLTQNSR